MTSMKKTVLFSILAIGCFSSAQPASADCETFDAQLLQLELVNIIKFRSSTNRHVDATALTRLKIALDAVLESDCAALLGTAVAVEDLKDFRFAMDSTEQLFSKEGDVEYVFDSTNQVMNFTDYGLARKEERTQREPLIDFLNSLLEDKSNTQESRPSTPKAQIKRRVKCPGAPIKKARVKDEE